MESEDDSGADVGSGKAAAVFEGFLPNHRRRSGSAEDATANDL
jgi:hypothetical protein